MIIEIYKRALEARRSSCPPPAAHLSGGRTATPAALLWDSSVTADLGAQPAREARGLSRSAGSSPARGGRREAGGWGRRTRLCATARKSQRSGGGRGRKRREKGGRSGLGSGNLGAARAAGQGAAPRHCPPHSGTRRRASRAATQPRWAETAT